MLAFNEASFVQYFLQIQRHFGVRLINVGSGGELGVFRVREPGPGLGF